MWCRLPVFRLVFVTCTLSTLRGGTVTTLAIGCISDGDRRPQRTRAELRLSATDLGHLVVKFSVRFLSRVAWHCGPLFLALWRRGYTSSKEARRRNTNVTDCSNDGPKWRGRGSRRSKALRWRASNTNLGIWSFTFLVVCGVVHSGALVGRVSSRVFACAIAASLRAWFGRPCGVAAVLSSFAPGLSALGWVWFCVPGQRSLIEGFRMDENARSKSWHLAGTAREF